MPSSIQARVVLASVALLVFSVVASTATDYSLSKANMEAAIDHDLTSSANDHSAASGDVSMSGTLLAAVPIPVTRDGVLKAVLVGDIELESVIENVRSIHPAPVSFGIRIDRSGGHELRASSPPHTFCHLLGYPRAIALRS